MSKPHYLDIRQAIEVLSTYGIQYNERQMRRAAEKNVHGYRKLPFFIDPIDKKLKIDRNTLLSIYFNRQIAAENSTLTSEFD